MSLSDDLGTFHVCSGVLQYQSVSSLQFLHVFLLCLGLPSSCTEFQMEPLEMALQSNPQGNHRLVLPLFSGLVGDSFANGQTST